MALDDIWISYVPEMQEAGQETDFTGNCALVDHFSVLDYYLDWSPVPAVPISDDPAKEEAAPGNSPTEELKWR